MMTSAVMPMSDAPTDGTSILLLHEHHGWIEGRFDAGSWSEDTPVNPAEYSGDAWILGDDLEQCEVENPNYPEATNLKGWLPLGAITAADTDNSELAERNTRWGGEQLARETNGEVGLALSQAFGEPIHVEPREFIERVLAGMFGRQPDMSGDQRQRLMSGELRAVEDVAGMLMTAIVTLKTSADEEVERLQHVLDRDRYIVAAGTTAIQQAISGRLWLFEGRGHYDWDDDRYRAEFKDALQAIEAALTPLKLVAWDKSDCTRIEERVVAARQAAQDMLRSDPGPREMIGGDLGLPDALADAEAKLTEAVEALRGLLKGVGPKGYVAGAIATSKARAFLAKMEPGK
jgi:hypothetical protein